MRTLLAVLDHVETAPAVLAAAALVAQRLHIERIDVLHVRAAQDPTFMPTEEVMTPKRQAQFEAHEAGRSGALRTLFDAWRPGAKADWREETGEKAAIVGDSAKRTDLLVIGRARHAPGEGKTAIEAALFAAAAPVLLVPPTVPKLLGARIAVAWKPSETAERAVVAATPLLRAAELVTVLTATDGEAEPERTPPEMLVQTLADLPALPEISAFAPGGEPIGPALLHEASRIGADLLVMGAYAHRRSMEAVFGGATRAILTSADLPVFLHH